MNKALFVTFSALALLPQAEAKPDFNAILGRLTEVGVQAVQQADEAITSPMDIIRQELNEVKEAYKEEGRAYARELGDTMMERAMANKKVDRTLDSVRALCWGVVAYITVVSLLLFGMMLRIQSLLGKLKEKL